MTEPHLTPIAVPDRLRRARIIVCGTAFFLAGAEFLGCDPTVPIDLHFDSSLGADFNAPPPQGDAGVETASDASEAGAP